MYICKLPFKIKGMNYCVTFARTSTNKKDHLVSRVVLAELWVAEGHRVGGRGDLRNLNLIPV